MKTREMKKKQLEVSFTSLYNYRIHCNMSPMRLAFVSYNAKKYYNEQKMGNYKN